MVHRVTYRDRRGEQRKTSRYYASLSLPGARKDRVAGFSSKRSTETLERNLETLVALRAGGERPDRQLQRYFDGLPARISSRLVKLGLLGEGGADRGSRFIEEALIEFETHLVSKGDGKRHARDQVRQAKRVLVNLCGFQVLSEVSTEAVLQALARLREEGLSGATSNSYRQACRSFTRWAVKDGRLAEDPLTHLDPVKASSESNRRALTPDEQARLVSATRSQPRRAKLTGKERGVLYLLALQTGLRRGELLSLRRKSFDLAGPSPCVVIEHGHAKNKKSARLPLQAATAQTLRSFLADRLPAAPVFRASRHYRAAEVLEHDLEAAGIPVETEEGRLDFHALRVTFVTNLARAHVPLAQAQKLARHCDPKLTATIYSRFGFDEDAAAIAKLPDLSGSAG